MVVFAIFRKGMNPKLALTFAIIAALGGVLLGGRVASRIMSRVPVEGQGILGEHSLTIGPSGPVEETSVNRSTYSWQSVSDVVENGKYIYGVLPESVP
jgi:hypothetical protein